MSDSMPAAERANLTPPASDPALAAFGHLDGHGQGRGVVIGIVGGIGSGKTTVAQMFGPLGAEVISSDELNRQVLQEPDIVDRLVELVGPQVLAGPVEGQMRRINPRSLADSIFAVGADDLRRSVQAVLHPRIDEHREQAMSRAWAAGVPMVVIDSPLLLETGLDRVCDALVFVACPADIRRQRVAERRGWSDVELHRREKMQWPLDTKQHACHYTVQNDTDLDSCRLRVQHLFPALMQSRR